MRKVKIGMITIVAVLLILLIGMLLSGRNNPGAEMNKARKRLTEAENRGARKFARLPYQRAWDSYHSALREWKRQNERFVLLRHYETTVGYARQADSLAGLAILAAGTNMVSTGENLSERTRELEKKLETFESRFGNFPLTSRERADIGRCKLMLNEAAAALKKNNHPVCRGKLEDVDTTLSRLRNECETKLDGYFLSYGQWCQWVEHTVERSRKQRSCCIVIDKLDRKCLLYSSGELTRSFPVELGTNWMGDKNRQGDKSTPEGIYRIISKKGNGSTRYYKALMLDYPNPEDRKRFSQNRKLGVIGHDADIGGNIEIHGEGGKGFDWTNGCIALADADMDILFMSCEPGTPVTIVGSLRPLDEILKDER